MKRTVKMWAVVNKDGKIHSSTWKCFIYSDEQAARNAIPGEAVLPVTVTYDDGKPRTRVAR